MRRGICLPYFSGERTPIHDPLAKGAFFGLDLTHTRADLFRAALEGVAMATAHVMDTYREVDAPPNRVLAVGGGTQNRVWMQATSDVARVSKRPLAPATATLSLPLSRPGLPCRTRSRAGTRWPEP